MSDAKRTRILAAATAVFAERDFHRVQVSEVARRAGVGKGTVYLYFPSKDDLHQAALEASLQQLAADVEDAAGAAAALDVTLEAVVRRILRFFWKRQHLLTLVQRYERRAGRGARDRRHRLGPAEHRTLTAAFLLGLARAAILDHAAGDRPEDVSARVVQLYLHGLTGAPRPVRALRRTA